MDRLANGVIVSWGVRRQAISFAAGAASVLSQPPFFLFFVLWITLPVLVWLIDGAIDSAHSGTIRRLIPAFVTGWWFGFGYFLAGLWWIGSAFFVEADRFGILLPFAILGLPAILSLFWGVGAALAQIFWRDGWQRIFALAAGIGLAEWLRGILFTGFPWNEIGQALTAGEIMMQSVVLFGSNGLNVLAVIIFAAPAVLAPADDGRRSFGLPIVAVAMIGALALFGFVRLSGAPLEFEPDTKIRIVQPAIAQSDKWRPENRDRIVRTHLELSQPAGRPKLDANTVLVWPEMALPFVLAEAPDALAQIGKLLPEGATLVTGAARAENLPGEPRRIFNSIMIVADDGTLEAGYDKVHLVPFGEYLPFQAILESMGLRQLSNWKSAFADGTRRRLLTLAAAPPFAPLICYEIIFANEIVSDDVRPGFLLNVTNDAWFGRTPGPYQHFHIARLRALEQGLPLVRAANTGISALTDAYGRIIVQAGLFERVSLDSQLPVALPSRPFATYNRFVFLLLLLICVFAAFTRFFNRTLDK